MLRKSPFLLILLLIAGVLVLVYLSLDESQKRMLAHLAKQVPYLPGRYYI
jgi:threonine/homoserine/homoserine lactone efflux protein